MDRMMAVLKRLFSVLLTTVLKGERALFQRYVLQIAAE